MKIPLNEAARCLGLHPLNFLIAFRTMGGIADCWPHVDEDFIETLQTMGVGAKQLEENTHIKTVSELEPSLVPRDSKKLSVTQNGANILDKLERKKYWARHTITMRTIHNDLCKGIPNLDEEIRNLVTEGLIVESDKTRGVYSLNQKEKDRIDYIIKTIRKKN